MSTLEQTIDVNVAPQVAFSLWTRFEDFPRFMEGIREVRRLDNNRLHWRAMRHDHEVEWDSEIMEQIPDQLIRWRDLSGEYRGSIMFEPLQAGQTRIRMRMEFDALPVDKEQQLTQRIAGDLERFKQMAESGDAVQVRSTAAAHASADATASPIGKTVGQTREERVEAETSAGGGANAGDQSSRSGQGADAKAEGGGRSSGPQAWLRNQFSGWDDPIGLVRKVTDEVDQLFARFIGRPSAAKSGEGGVTGKWMPAVEILQRGDRLVICAELPGISRNSVDVEIQRDRVVIEGERKEEPQPSDVPGFRRSERSYGPFHRTVPLPEGVDPDSARATMRDGVLEISLRMPTPAERRGKRLDIQS
jgi:HSP20 family molecular chaperone IbpA